MSDGGKGSKPRPLSVSNEEYASRWDAIFGRDKRKDDPQPSSEREAQTELDEDNRQGVQNEK